MSTRPSLAISICIYGDYTPELGDRLREATPAVVAQCKQALYDCEDSLSPEEERALPIEGLEEEVEISIIKVTGKDPTTPTANFGGVTPVAYTQRETRKFGDHVLDCLWQMRPDTANVLAVKIDSTPHDQRDLIEALHQLGQQVIAGEEEFFRRERKGKSFAGSRDFYDRLVVLSAVVVKSIWNSGGGLVPCNQVWCNPRAIPLKEEVIEHLRSM